MAYTPPAYNNIVIGSNSTAYTAPLYNNIIIGEITIINEYAVVMYNNYMITISSDLVGTGLVPLVFNQVTKKVHPKIEGQVDIPVILKNGKLTTLAENENLLI